MTAVTRCVVMGLAALLASASPALGQNPKPDDAFAQALFDPQLVLRHCPGHRPDAGPAPHDSR